MQFEKDIESKHKNLFLSVRTILLSNTGIIETKKDKITTYSYNNSGLCHLRTMPHGIDIGFLKGFLINDPYNLLHGKTKKMRVLSLDSLLENELKHYIAEAINKNL
jgi:hypothetical protein